MTIQRYGVTKRYSDCVVHNGTVYLVEVPSNTDAGIADQAADLLASVERLLVQVGSSKSHLLQVTIYLSDMADYAAMNSVWDAWLPAGCAPVRACVQSELADPKCRLEMVVTAALS